MTATTAPQDTAEKAAATSAGKHRRGSRPAPAAPERRCLASGEVLPKAQLLRFVVAPDGTLVPDLAERLPGRGLWLQARQDMMAKACARNLFAKAAKRHVRVPDDLPRQVEALALRRCLDLLGLARRAGAVVAGFEKVKAALRSGEVGVLVQADDAADDGRQKIQALARAVGASAVGPRVRMLQFCGAADLGAAVGREAAVHVGIAPGRFAEGLIQEVQRLAGLRGVAEQGNGVGRPTEGER
ncbi:RNA-binding protein [Pelagibius sp. 7325]|uniref:RNA-binding protein n=1 Tax=Pelagibius sp. 7325 TaxID=3131994 RepID=UPI0030EE42F1